MINSPLLQTNSDSESIENSDESASEVVLLGMIGIGSYVVHPVDVSRGERGGVIIDAITLWGICGINVEATGQLFVAEVVVDKIVGIEPMCIVTFVGAFETIVPMGAGAETGLTDITVLIVAVGNAIFGMAYDLDAVVLIMVVVVPAIGNGLFWVVMVINDDVVFGINGLVIRLTVVVLGREVVVNLFTTGAESVGKVLIMVVVGTVRLGLLLVMIGLFIMVVAYFGTSGTSGIFGTVVGSFAEVVTVIILDCVVGKIVVLNGTDFFKFGMVVIGFT